MSPLLRVEHEGIIHKPVFGGNPALGCHFGVEGDAFFQFLPTGATVDTFDGTSRAAVAIDVAVADLHAGGIVE
eukprot:CAMPEP_0201635524 /NCGR_PEP_ID=MMETSP0493-20130528/8030_1 /ASSEMBLY_ACC=CAM_ASM_000838 /TAXON_ID=420259 /ORGANISM="Thalassiosira gravida, Strain GMp14c1" /LENGTH=72 /DNA_ID=CAMNT_0048107505 /DNA_START=1104 /DNA_END=1319 /DNA_ORIENTATION=-